MKYGIQIGSNTYTVRFEVEVLHKDLTRVFNEISNEFLRIDFVSKGNRDSLLLSSPRSDAKIRIPIGRHQPSFLSASTASAAEKLLKKVVSILRDLYNVVMNPIMKFLGSMAKAKIEVHKNTTLDLEDISKRIRSLGYKVVYSGEDRGYELSLYLGKAVAKLTHYGKILLFGFINPMQMHRAVTLLKSVCSMSSQGQKVLHYLEEYRAARPEIEFSIVKKKILLTDVAPSQCKVHKQDVSVYEELISRGASPEVCALETLLNEKPYALIDGHHRAKACQESGREYVDAFVICPSRPIASRIIEEARLDGIMTIADLKFTDDTL
jgi:uncharacterized ParB-like nuclease family protein